MADKSYSRKKQFRKNGIKLMVSFFFTVSCIIGLAIADQYNFNLVSKVKNADSNSNIEIVDNYAVISSFNQGIDIINISDPSHPRDVGYIDVKVSSEESLCIHSHLLFTGDLNNGMKIFNISNVQAIQPIGFYSAAVRDISVNGSYAYILDANNGLIILNISDPSSPQKIGQFSNGEEFSQMAIVEPYAYIISKFYLKIVDISNTSQPVEIGKWNSVLQEGAFGSIETFDGNAIAIKGHVGFLAEDSGICILDLSTPSHPSQIGSYTKLSKPSHPSQMGSYTKSAYYGKVMVHGDYLYALNQLSSLQIFDLADLTSISKVREYTYAGDTLRGYQVKGDFLYTATTNGYFEIIDTWSSTDTIIEKIFFGLIVCLSVFGIVESVLIWRWWRDKNVQPIRNISDLGSNAQNNRNLSS